MKVSLDQTQNYEFRNQLEPNPWTEVAQLIHDVGWGHRDPESTEAAFVRSHVQRFCFADQRLIGIGRSVDDGHFYAQIVDIAVHGDHRGRGIGTRIVDDICRGLEGFVFTTLTAAPGRAPLYKEFFHQAREAQRTEVHCITPSLNKTSIVFHQAMGLELAESPHHDEGIPIHRNYNGRGDDYVLFRRSIAKPGKS